MRDVFHCVLSRFDNTLTELLQRNEKKALKSLAERSGNIHSGAGDGCMYTTEEKEGG